MNIVEPIKSRIEIKKVEVILAQSSARDLLMFVMGTNSGLRISDILSFNIRDVKDKDFITVTEKKTHKRKVFPVNDKLKMLIKNFIQNKNDNEPLFKSRYGRRLDRTRAYRIINMACKQAGIKGKIGTHTLRKTFGYHHYKKFKDIAILQKIFNHYSESTTLRYIGIEQDEINKSYECFVL